jgi:hypothetical protein
MLFKNGLNINSEGIVKKFEIIFYIVILLIIIFLSILLFTGR